jgi:transcriptional regulator with XRE-family HTH domain
MSTKKQITGRQIAAARALTGVSQADLADAAQIPVAALKRMEASGSAQIRNADHAAAVRLALENFGAMFLAENKNAGAGVRLKFTRLDAKQIGRMENEGGPAGSDDGP